MSNVTVPHKLRSNFNINNWYVILILKILLAWFFAMSMESWTKLFYNDFTKKSFYYHRKEIRKVKLEFRSYSYYSTLQSSTGPLSYFYQKKKKLDVAR